MTSAAMASAAFPPPKSEQPSPWIARIPFDLFVSKKHFGLALGEMGFANASGVIVFRVSRRSSQTKKRVILDAAGKNIMTVYRVDDGSWKGLSGDCLDNEDLIFVVKMKFATPLGTELEVSLVRENGAFLTVKGCPIRKSCTIYRGESIVAQTSLMYKLKQVWVKKSEFRLTTYPGVIDHAIIVALVVIFLEYRKAKVYGPMLDLLDLCGK